MRILLLLSAILFCFELSAQNLWKLKTGESFVGEEIGRTQTSVTIKLSYGTLELDLSNLESESPVQPTVKVASAPEPKAEDKPKPSPAKTPAYKSVTTTSTSRNLLPSHTLSKTATTTTMDALFPNFEQEWMTSYKEFVQEYMPEGLLMKFRLSYANIVTNSNKSALDMGVGLQKTWYDVHEVFVYGFYSYSKDTYPATGNRNVSMDKFGAGGEYAYYFLGADSGWFATTTMDYKTDYIKYIDMMTDNMVGIGYDFNFLEDYGVDFDIAAGPGYRYVDIGIWIPILAEKIHLYDGYFMGYVRQNLTWRITKNLRLEQKAVFAFDAMDMKWFERDEYENSFYLSVGLVYAPTDVFSISLRYSYDYDSANAFYAYLRSSTAEDTRFIISVEIPFGWRN